MFLWAYSRKLHHSAQNVIGAPKHWLFFQPAHTFGVALSDFICKSHNPTSGVAVSIFHHGNQPGTSVRSILQLLEISIPPDCQAAMITECKTLWGGTWGGGRAKWTTYFACGFGLRTMNVRKVLHDPRWIFLKSYIPRHHLYIGQVMRLQ